MIQSLRLAVGTLTIFPVPPPEPVDRRVAGGAMALAPVVGSAPGVLAAVVLWGASHSLGPWPAALLAVAVLAVLTRLIHWDGLADLADGLGSGRPAREALEIMRRGDVGPFGVVTIVLVLGLQVGALADLGAAGPPAVLLAVVLGRWSMTLACRSAVPAARPDGLGAEVAGSVGVTLLLAAALSTALLAVVTALAGDLGLPATLLAVLLVTGWSLVLTAVAVVRLGGVTGDVLGALAESSTALALLTLALWP
ncbi:MAG: adenosylcobinamide-GDP ribazoletransferase [Propionibacteriales bacterium]|nr:adenosylcobinamide-GDP ribazoletransferase [Propionibacteriales bacterium]